MWRLSGRQGLRHRVHRFGICWAGPVSWCFLSSEEPHFDTENLLCMSYLRSVTCLLGAITDQTVLFDMYALSIFNLLLSTTSKLLEAPIASTSTIKYETSNNVVFTELSAIRHATFIYFPTVFYINIANFRALFGWHHSVQLTNNTSSQLYHIEV